METHLRKLPYYTLRDIYRALRRDLFSKPRPEGTYLTVRKPVPIRQVLGEASFAPNWELSYNYKGEDLNLARVVYDPDTAYDPTWWQTHVRGWQTEGKWWLRAHYEPEPVEHPKKHLQYLRPENRSGFVQTYGVLEGAGYDWETEEWSR